MLSSVLTLSRETCFGLLLCLFSLATHAPAWAQSEAGARADALPREVPFLTLRNKTGSTDPGAAYGDERSTPSAGVCRLRQIDLNRLAPLAEQVPFVFREELLRVDRVTELPKDALLNALQASLGETGPVLYVHGYNLAFGKGCRRAALFQGNAGLQGRFLWFTWPSDGAVAFYTHDEADLYWSVPDIAAAIIELGDRFGTGAVAVVGHSLGARGVVLALYEVANRNPDMRLGEVVLLAPDMDFEIFQRILPRISLIAESITVYVTKKDQPLGVSAQLHGYARLGEAGNDVSTLTGVEVIDLSEIPSGDPTGHLYHIFSSRVGADLAQLLNESKRATDRRDLYRRGPNLWMLKSEDASEPD